ncbi:hypothetical protein [Denitratimonas sp. CY0512]|uniref:hypothetical protein n=1 Tax=Denitratimonas sp. CY0512 TaxID=3131940 RepID=UPI00309F34C9
MASPTDDPQQDRRIRLAVLGACVLAHVVLGLWMLRDPARDRGDDGALQVEFIPAVPAMQPPPPPPPFPEAPQRPRASPPVVLPRATPSAPPDPPVASPSPAAAAPQRTPDTMEVMDAIRAAARTQVEQAMPFERDPMQRHTARVPGRAESYTPNPIMLRRSITPEDILRTIGTLFGGNYNPCPDTQSKIRDLAARNERIGEDELQVLIDRERRRCR